MLTVSTKPYNGWSRNNFPFNMEGCVFYAPLWQEDVQGSPFLSYDQYLHTCTVTGAIWTPQGRTFDGDDLIKHTAANWRGADHDGSVSFWFKCTDITDVRTLLSSGDEDTAANNLIYFAILNATGELFVFQRDTADVYDLVKGSTNVGDGQFHFATIATSGTAYSIYLDGASEALSVVNGANTGNWFDVTGARDNLCIGARIYNATDYYFVGTIGDVLVHSSPLSLAGHNQLRLATMWRYAA